MRNWRYRLAQRLLGYRPHQLPDTDGVYIVTLQGSVTMTIAAKTFTMQRTTVPRHIAVWSADHSTLIGRLPARSGGTFSGTL